MKEKPRNCDCQYPETVLRNGSGHLESCSVHKEWQDKGGFKNTENHPIFRKIDEGTVTSDDFNALIKESMPECTRDRTRRRTLRNATSGHQDQAGHQQLDMPKFADRVQPKRERSAGTQANGRGKQGHRNSTRTQRRKAKAGMFESVPERFQVPLQTIVDNIGKDITDTLLAEFKDGSAAQTVITKLMALPDINRDWLQNLSVQLDARRPTRRPASTLQ